MIISRFYRSICQAACVAVPVFLASCSTISLPSLTKEAFKVAPAMQVLALDFERTNFKQESRVSGRLAKEQRELHAGNGGGKDHPDDEIAQQNPEPARARAIPANRR